MKWAIQYTGICKVCVFSSVMLFLTISSFAQSGKKNSLEGKSIRDIHIYFDTSVAMMPSARIPIGVEATLPEGRFLRTKGFLNGHAHWDENYKIEVDGGYFLNGVIHVAADYHLITNHTVQVTVTPISRPDLIQTLSIPLDYIGDVYGYFDGKNGTNGISGMRGWDGHTGDSVDVYVQAYRDAILNVILLKIKISDRTTGKVFYFLVNPAGGRLIVHCNGGHGGTGGRGSSGTGTRSGDGGDGGHGGDGGDGGTVCVFLNSEAEPFKTDIVIYNAGGRGGSGGYGGSAGSSSSSSHSSSSSFSRGRSGSSGISGRFGRPGPAPVFTVQVVIID